MAIITGDTKLNKVRSFVDEIIAKLPEADRAAARAGYSQAQDEVSTLARDIEAAAVQVNTTATQQHGWYEKHKDVIEGRANGNQIVQAVDGDKITKELGARLDATKDELAGQGLYLATVIPTLIDSHRAEFGEGLDGEQLAKDAIKAGTDIKTYYNQSVAGKRSERATATRTAEITAAEARGREAGMREAGNGHIPFPVGNRSPTTLSGLRATPEQRAAAANDHTLEAAVATATSMIQKQAAG